MKNVSDKSVEKIKTHFFPETCAVCEIMWKNVVEGQATDENILRRVRITCWITTATNTFSEYVILIAFPRLQWLLGCSSVLRYTYIARLVFYMKSSSEALLYTGYKFLTSDWIQDSCPSAGRPAA